jgi:hypothetical protein
MIFITPYVIKNEAEAAELTRKKGEAMENFRQEYRIEKKNMGGLIESRKPAPPSQPAEKPGADVNVPPAPPAGKTPVPTEGAR